MAPQEPSLVEQVIPITGSTTSGSVFNPSTQLIRVHADAICSIVIGTGPAATTANKRLAANQTEFFGVGFGQTIAVISNV